MSRRAATTTTSICGSRALLGGDAADHLMLEHRLVERHRDLLLGLEADRRVHLLRVLDRRQTQRADDDALVADPEPHPLGELVSGEERLQRVGEPIGIEHLALVEDPGVERLDRRGGDLRGAVGAAHLGRGDAARLDLEADDAAGLLLPGQLQSHGVIRDAPWARPPFLNRQKGRRPFALQLPISRRTWTPGLRRCSDTSRRSGRRPAGRRRRRGRETGRTESPACAPQRHHGRSSPGRRASRRAGRRGSPGATLRPR